VEFYLDLQQIPAIQINVISNEKLCHHSTMPQGMALFNSQSTMYKNIKLCMDIVTYNHALFCFTQRNIQVGKAKAKPQIPSDPR